MKGPDVSTPPLPLAPPAPGQMTDAGDGYVLYRDCDVQYRPGEVGPCEECGKPGGE